jgi:uncharacterized protein YhbP (UPF0306 family)
VQVRGVVVTGQGLGRQFTNLPWAREQFVEKLGIDPYPGTLNLRLTDPAMQQQWGEWRCRQAEVIRPGTPDACEAQCFHVDVNGSQAAAIVWPQVDAYPPDQIELIAGVDLRQRFGLSDGSNVTIQAVSPAEALRRTVQGYLTAHNVLSLATYGPDGAWAASVFYVHMGWTFYFLSAPESRHSRNLAANPQVAATINPDYTDWREIRGVQLQGVAARVRSPAERARGFQAYQHKYPFINQQQSPAELARALGKVRLYRLLPSCLLFVDNSRGLGHREAVDL